MKFSTRVKVIRVEALDMGARAVLAQADGGGIDIEVGALVLDITVDAGQIIFPGAVLKLTLTGVERP